MVDLYVERILKGVITIEKVPAKWRKQVEDKLAELQPKNETPVEEDND